MILTQISTTAQSTLKEIRRLEGAALAAENAAVRVEGFRLMRLLRAEIRRGAPGGRAFAALSQIRLTQRRRGKTALAGLARAIGYEVAAQSPIALKIGFVGPASSSTWRRLAERHQAGFSASADAPYFRKHAISVRQFLAQEGSRIDKTMFGGKKSRRRNVFFLRKSTANLSTPARPIVDPFWSAHRAAATRNIRSNFIRKMRGERI